MSETQPPSLEDLFSSDPHLEIQEVGDMDEHRRYYSRTLLNFAILQIERFKGTENAFEEGPALEFYEKHFQRMAEQTQPDQAVPIEPILRLIHTKPEIAFTHLGLEELLNLSKLLTQVEKLDEFKTGTSTRNTLELAKATVNGGIAMVEVMTESLNRERFRW